MTKQRPVSGASLPLRAAQEALARQRIVAAAAALLAEEQASSLSLAIVARRAGVSRATIYRYFPSLDTLFDAVAAHGDENTAAWLDGRPVNLDLLPEVQRRLWSDLARQIDFIRAQHVTPAGRAIRARRSARRRIDGANLLRAAGIDSETPTGKRLLALGMLLLSSAALLELHEVYGIPVDEAARYAGWASAVLARETLRLQRRTDEATDRDRSGAQSHAGDGFQSG
jgi:AcrR family transcriptional regulator